MGDRFYAQQKAYTPKRRLKKDYIKELQEILETDIEGLDRLTIKTLDELTSTIVIQLTASKYSKTLKRLADA